MLELNIHQTPIDILDSHPEPQNPHANLTSFSISPIFRTYPEHNILNLQSILLMKGALLALLLSITLSISDSEILQHTFNGIYKQNHLPQPTTILSCVNNIAIKQSVTFIGKLLSEAAQGSLSELLYIPVFIREFYSEISPESRDCLLENKELQTLHLKYNPNHRNFSETNKLYVEYTTKNYGTVHKWFKQLNDLWVKAKYYDVGYHGATYTHHIYHLSEKERTRQGQGGEEWFRKRMFGKWFRQVGQKGAIH